MLGKLAVIAQAHACLVGVEQRNASAWRIGQLGRGAWSASPAIVRAGIGPARGEIRAIAQGGNNQHRRAHEAQEVQPGDHQHQLSVARHSA